MGLAVTVIEKMPSILAGWEPEAIEPVRKSLAEGGVTVLEGVTVSGFNGTDGQVRTVETDGPEVPADLVVVAVGIRPAAALAEKSGIALGARGAVAVDREMKTNVPGIWAAGDCAEQWHRLLRKNVWVPLGTNANKQGRIAGENAAGGHAIWEGMIGSAVFRTLGIDAARTGIGRDEAREAGIEVAVSSVDGWDAAHGMTERRPIRIVLVSRKDNGRVVGAQMVGGGVAKRCDVLATAIWAGMTVRDVGNLDLTYAPPFSPVWDPILVAANVAEKDFDPNDLDCRFCE
jgi:NADPH-dependent 2,4-dienoyl-CoA reductase/sulfur reductase-like enzyme